MPHPRADSCRQRTVVLSPQPVLTAPRDGHPGRNAPGADDHAPVLAVGIGRVRTERWDIDPGDHGGIGGQRGLNFVQPGDLAGQRTVIVDELGLELTQGDTRQLALALQLIDSLGLRGLIGALGIGFDQAVEPIEFE